VNFETRPSLSMRILTSADILAPTATLVVGWIHSLKNRSWSIFPYRLNSEDRAGPPVVEPVERPSSLSELAGAILTDSFLASSVGFFASVGVALFLGEGFGVAFASADFFGVGLGVGFAVGLTEGLGTGVLLGLGGGGVETGDGEGVAMGS
jgi:hypothetical protein